MFVLYGDDTKAKGIGNYWNEKFPIMCTEECAELQLAISKHERYSNPATLKNLKEEIRDALICIFGLMARFGISQDEINEMVKEKMDRIYE